MVFLFGVAMPTTAFGRFMDAVTRKHGAPATLRGSLLKAEDLSLTKDLSFRLLPRGCSCAGCTIVGPCPPSNRIQCRYMPEERPGGNVLHGVDLSAWG